MFVHLRDFAEKANPLCLFADPASLQKGGVCLTILAGGFSPCVREGNLRRRPDDS
jgi:hypothetical protein